MSTKKPENQVEVGESKFHKNDEYILYTFKRHASILEKTIGNNAEIMVASFEQNFTEKDKRPILLLRCTLEELVMINSAAEEGDFDLWHKKKEYISLKEALKLQVSDNQHKLFKGYQGYLVFCNMCTVKSTGATSILSRSFVIHKNKDERHIKIYHKLDKELSEDKEKRKEWVKDLKKLIEDQTRKLDLKYPPDIEECFDKFIEKFEYSPKRFIIEKTYIEIWPERNEDKGENNQK